VSLVTSTGMALMIWMFYNCFNLFSWHLQSGFTSTTLIKEEVSGKRLELNKLITTTL